MMVSFTLFAQKKNQLSDSEKEELYRTEVREAMGLDYSMPDYSINKIDSEKMGTRLTKIVEFLCENYDHDVYSNTLSCIVEEQIKDLNHPVIKKLKLKNVKKVDNEITISFDAILWPNNLNIKRTDIILVFVDGVSESRNVNDLFSYMARYVNVHKMR